MQIFLEEKVCFLVKNADFSRENQILVKNAEFSREKSDFGQNC